MLACLLLVSASATAQYSLRSSAFGVGGGRVAGPGFELVGTVGLVAAGAGSSDTLVLGSGFVHLVNPPAGPIALPVATADVVSTNEDAEILIDVLANDFAGANDSLRIIRLESARHGFALVSGGGIRYKPKPDYFGPDTLGYSVANSLGGVSSADVFIEVIPVNDPPEFTSTPVTAAVAGIEYRYDVELADIDSDTLSVAGPVLPPWVSLRVAEGSAILVGTPASADIGRHEIELVAGDGIDTTTQRFTIDVAINVATEGAADIPSEFALHQSYPNPFNPSTTIPFDLPESTFVTLTVHDALGRVVQVLTSRDYAAGRHKVVFEAGDLPSGMYIYRLNAAGAEMAGKTLLQK